MGYKFGKSKKARGWEPRSRLQLSNVTESQTRGASCVVLTSNPTSFLPSSIVQASSHHLRCFPYYIQFSAWHCTYFLFFSFVNPFCSIFLAFFISHPLYRRSNGDSSARMPRRAHPGIPCRIVYTHTIPISNCNPIIMILMILMLMKMKMIMMMISFHLWFWAIIIFIQVSVTPNVMGNWYDVVGILDQSAFKVSSLIELLDLKA